MGRPKGSRNKLKSISLEQQEALAPKRRGRPVGSKNRKNNTVEWDGETRKLDDILRPPTSVLSDQPATDEFCPVAGNRVHYGYRGIGWCWCTYCGLISPTLVFPDRKAWN